MVGVRRRPEREIKKSTDKINEYAKQRSRTLKTCKHLSKETLRFI